MFYCDTTLTPSLNARNDDKLTYLGVVRKLEKVILLLPFVCFILCHQGEQTFRIFFFFNILLVIFDISRKFLT